MIELEQEIKKQNNEEKIVQLVETVSRKLVDSNSNLNQVEFLKSLMNLFESLHCWSLVESESFLFLMANVGDPANQNAGNDSHLATGVSIIQDGRLFRPSRCDVNVEYVVFVQSKR